MGQRSPSGQGLASHHPLYSLILNTAYNKAITVMCFSFFLKSILIPVCSLARIRLYVYM